MIDANKAQGSMPRVDAGLVGLLLQRLNVSVPKGALENAFAQVTQQMPQQAPNSQLNALFKLLQLQGVNAAQLRWQRFDHRRLPALICYREQWWLVDRDSSERLRLTDSNGQVEQLEAGMLEAAVVLWVRTPTDEASASGFSLKGNIAAKLVLKEVFRSRRWLSDVLIATVVINILAVGTSLFAMQVYDRVVPTLAFSTLWALVAVMAVVAAMDWLLKTVRARTLDSVSCTVDKKVSQQVFDHVMHLQLDSRPRSLGTLAAQLSGLDSVRQFFTSSTIFILADMPFALMFIAIIALVGGPVAWVYLLLLPVAGALGWLTQKRLRGLMQRQLMRANERQGLLVDSIQGAESVRSNNASWRFSEKWQSITQSVLGYNIQQRAISNIATVTTSTLSTAAYVGAVVVGVNQIAAGNITMGALIACSILGGRVIAPIAQSVQFLSQWQNVSQSLQMVNQVLQLDSERRPEQNLLMPDGVPESLALEGVRFSYPESPMKQLDVDQLSLKAGDRVALLGNVGSGKSTLLKVLAGLYRPSEGRVRLGQADLWEMAPGLVANYVAYLPQAVHLFKGTLYSNLALSGAVSDSHLLQVCEELGIDNIANQSPKGMDHEIFEGGDGLSGGQRQLVGLGRVFLAEPKIWLLDEPTASLDNESEKQVLDAVMRYVKDDDILVVATHRPLLASKLANRVLLVKEGKIAADGAPEQVLAKVFGKPPGAVRRRPEVDLVAKGGPDVI